MIATTREQDDMYVQRQREKKPWKVKWVANPNEDILFTWQELDGIIKLWKDGMWTVIGPVQSGHGHTRGVQRGFENWEFAT